MLLVITRVILIQYNTKMPTVDFDLNTIYIIKSDTNKIEPFYDDQVTNIKHIFEWYEFVQRLSVIFCRPRSRWALHFFQNFQIMLDVLSEEILFCVRPLYVGTIISLSLI